MTQQKTDAELGLLGISRRDYEIFTRNFGDGLHFVRASEPCELRAHRLTNPSDEVLAAFAEVERDTDEDSSARLAVGNAVEGIILNSMSRQLGQILTDEQFTTYYHHPEWHVLMTGHVDAMAHPDGEKMRVAEAKSTSDERWHEVLAAIDIGDVRSEMLEKYLRQMRRYAAMTFLMKAPYNYSQIFNPLRGYLGIMNRNSCAIAVRDVQLFDEDEDIERFIRAEIEEQFAGKHPSEGEIPRPKQFFRGHPICDTCATKKLCYGEPSPQSEIDKKTAKWALDYADGDLYHKLGERIKKRVKASVVEYMDEKGIDRVRLDDKVSVSRHEQMSRAGKVDYAALRKDKVYDKYVAPAKPFKMVRFNIKR